MQRLIRECIIHSNSISLLFVKRGVETYFPQMNQVLGLVKHDKKDVKHDGSTKCGKTHQSE